jgi:hypothetical protein
MASSFRRPDGRPHWTRVWPTGEDNPRHDSFRLDAAVQPEWTGYTFDAGGLPTRSNEEVP